MNPDRIAPNESMDLPPVAPSVANEKSEAVQQLGTERNPEFIPGNNQGVSSPNPPPNQLSQVAQPIVDPNPPLTPPPSTPLVVDTDSLIADDADLIEKEWVERAKEIVHKTKDNPYLQNKAITKMKAEYIKKRYNKDIRTSED